MDGRNIATCLTPTPPIPIYIYPLQHVPAIHPNGILPPPFNLPRGSLADGLPLPALQTKLH
jgi:hypothetical protein